MAFYRQTWVSLLPT